MERGASWTSHELFNLANAWITATADPIIGIDQTAARFSATLHISFIDLASHEDAMTKRYEARSANSVKATFESVAPDIQKIQTIIRLVMPCNPTCTTEHQVLSLAISFHVGKIHKMSNDFKDLNHEMWPVHLSYKVLVGKSSKVHASDFGDEKQSI